MDETVVTGAGIVSPIGSGLDAFWDALLGGRRSFATIPHGVGVAAARCFL